MIAFALPGLIRGPRIVWIVVMLLAALMAVMEAPRLPPAALFAPILAA